MDGTKLTLFFKGMTKDDITQVFHSGHKAWDLVEYNTPTGKLYGTPLCAPENCLVLGVTKESLSHDNSGLEHGYGIRLRGLETGHDYLYWHTLPTFPVWGGDTVKRGQIVAYMGNAGYVTVGGVYVPLEERVKDPEPGTHLHVVVYKNGVEIDPMPLINWNWQPQYTFLDFVRAMMVVLKKISQNIK